MAEKRIGRQTPTNSFVLPYEKTLADEAVELYEKTGRKAMPWQKALLADVMAIDEEGLWVHMTVGYSLPRRNGKTEDVYMRELWGLLHDEKIAHTAHRNSTSHSSFKALKSLLEKMGFEEGEEFKSIKAFGNESITMLKTDGEIQYRTRTGAGGLGEGFDLLVIDEAQEYTETHQSALEYTVTSSPNPQTIMLGTPPTAVSKGTVFQPYREQCLSGQAEDSLWWEWSVDHKVEDRTDRDLWYETNPSLGQTLTERAVKKELALEEIDFNIQRLGLWLAYSQSSAVTRATWDALQVEELPKLTGKLFVGIKYGVTAKHTALSVAVKTLDGKIFVECLHCKEAGKGNGWILSLLSSMDVESVIIDGANGRALLADDIKDSRLKIKTVLPSVQDVIDAGTVFENGLFQSTICHRGQPSLTESVTNCDKRAIGSHGGFGYKSQKEDIDICLMESMILAHWACATAKPKKKQRISY